MPSVNLTSPRAVFPVPAAPHAHDRLDDLRFFAASISSVPARTKSHHLLSVLLRARAPLLALPPTLSRCKCSSALRAVRVKKMYFAAMRISALRRPRDCSFFACVFLLNSIVSSNHIVSAATGKVSDRSCVR